jgi:hypothetical protein
MGYLADRIARKSASPAAPSGDTAPIGGSYLQRRLQRLAGGPPPGAGSSMGPAMPPTDLPPGNSPAQAGRPPVSLPTPDIPFGDLTAAASVDDSGRSREMIAESLGLEHHQVFVDPKTGEMMYREGDEVGYIHDTGAAAWIKQAGAEMAADAPAILMGTGGAIVGGRLGGGKGAFTGGVIGTGLGTMVRQEHARQAYGDPTPPGKAGGIIAKDMLTAGAGELAFKIAGRLYNKVKKLFTGGAYRYLPDNVIRKNLVDEVEKQRIEQIRYLAQQHGITLAPHQLADRASLDMIWEFMRKHTATSDAVREFENTLSGQVSDAFENMVNKLGPQMPQSTSGRRIVEAANEAIDYAYKNMRQQTGPAYRAAKETAPNLDIVDEVTEMAAKIEAMADTPAKTAAEKVLRMFTREVEIPDKKAVAPWIDDLNMPDPDWQPPTIKERIPDWDLGRIDSAKKAADKYLKSGYSVKEVASSDKEALVKIQEMKNKILGKVDAQLREMPPEARALYQKARQLHGELKDAIDQLELGSLAPLTRMKTDKQMLKAVDQLFNPANVDERMVKMVKGAFTPDEWNAAMGAYMRQEWSRVMRETQGGTVVNRAGKIRQALFGEPKKVRIWQAAMEPQQFENFTGLMEILQRASKGFKENSNTAIFEEIKKDLVASMQSGAPIRRGVDNLLSPRKYMMDKLEEIDRVLVDARMKDLLDLMLDFKSTKLIEDVRGMTQKDEDIGRGLTLLSAFLTANLGKTYDRSMDANRPQP